ncbi:hypothetical protein [Tianweitania sediminis]|uniref:hypothetical protein n=1 Tax=Tianweitania sediminis TaxID=1502156 RepID=UPI001FD7C23B|nr:hypothetical protein [Tianweitania sediminis]
MTWKIQGNHPMLRSQTTFHLALEDILRCRIAVQEEDRQSMTAAIFSDDLAMTC